MALRKPTSVEECLYFTNRAIDAGKVTAWVFRKECPKCNGLMGKPQKKGKIDRKASHYACNSCGYQEGNEEEERGLVLNIKYKCPYCGNEGETTSDYKRKIFEGVPSYVFECQKCRKKIAITKKLKEAKKGKEGIAE